MQPRGCALSSKKRRRFVVWLGAVLAFGLVLISPTAVHAQLNSPPVVPSVSIVRSIPENSPPGYAVGEPVTESASNYADIVSYYLLGEDAELFAIDETTGQLRTRTQLDYEVKSEYVLQVRTKDRTGLHDVVPVAVKVMNLDEAAEVFLSPPIVQVGTELSASLIDPDGNISEMTWQWAVSPDKREWTVISGAETASYMPVATGIKEFLRAQVFYTDGHGPGKSAETVIDTGLRSHRVNFPPEFPYFESGVRTVSIDIPPFEYIGRPVVASDLDGDTLTYSLTGEAAALFEIELHSGRLMAKAPLDAQVNSRYFGEVHVTDGRGGEDSITVRIDVAELQVAVEPVTTPVPPPATTTKSMAKPELGVTLGSNPPVPPAQVEADPANPGSDNSPSPNPSSYAEPTPLPRAVPQLTSTRDISSKAVQAAASKPAGASPSAVADRSRPEPTAEPVAAVSSTGPTGPSGTLPGEATGAGAPATGSGQERGGLLGFLTSIPPWAFLFLVPVAVLAGILLARWLQARNREREVVLPPPSFGVERRLAPLPRIVATPPDEATA